MPGDGCVGVGFIAPTLGDHAHALGGGPRPLPTGIQQLEPVVIEERLQARFGETVVEPASTGQTLELAVPDLLEVRRDA
jgi:hypothetical protein